MHVVIAAYESIAAGDQHEALAILGNAIEDGDETSPRSEVFGPPLCPVCGVRAWPGEDWRHIYSAHNPPAWGRRAA
jgi:hypothetical protein